MAVLLRSASPSFVMSNAKRFISRKFTAYRPVVNERPEVNISQRNSKISVEEKKEERRGGDELTGVNLGPVDPATLQATKIACAHPPSLSFSGFGEQFS